jgi:hypothetical protein
MIQPSSKIQKSLLTALDKVENSPDLSPEEVEWVRQFAVRLITEFTVLQSHEQEIMAA